MARERPYRFIYHRKDSGHPSYHRYSSPPHHPATKSCIPVAVTVSDLDRLTSSTALQFEKGRDLYHGNDAAS